MALSLSYRCRLLLNSVHEDDSGTYMCKLSTVKGRVLVTQNCDSKFDILWRKKMLVIFVVRIPAYLGVF